MSKRILSIDQGHGYTKIALIEDGEVLTPKKEVDTIVEIDAVSAKDISSCVEFEGKYYLVGGSAIHASNGDHKNTNILDVTKYEGFRKAGVLIVKKNLAALSSVDLLVLSLSPAWIDKSEDYKKYISKGISWNLDKIIIVPQGAGAKRTIDLIGMNINSKTSKIELPNYLLFDIGFNTIDVVSVWDNKSLNGDRKGYSDMGVVKVSNELKAILKKDFKIEISHEEAREVLSSKRYKSSGKIIPLDKVIEKLFETYLQEIVKFIFENYADKVKVIDHIIFVGGGAEIIKSSLTHFKLSYRNRLGSEIGESFIQIPTTGSEYYNAIGGGLHGFELIKDIK